MVKYLTSGSADVINFYEFEMDKSHHISLNCKIPPTKVSVILGNISTVSDMRIAIEETASKGVGIIYVHGDSYNTLPPYFAETIRIASITKLNGFPKNCTG